MDAQFEGQVVLVTGATGNLGRAVVKRFANSGAKLVLVDLNQQRLDTLASELTNETLTSVTNLSDPNAVDALIRTAQETFGQVDVLAHTVGGYIAGKPTYESDLEVMQKMFELNVLPVYIVGGSVIRHMLEHKVQGRLIFVLARAALKGAKNMGPYTASKAAAQRVMESLSAEVKDKGIHVNGVSPSIIDTPPNRQDMPDADTSKWVTPEQVADAIAFLASAQANGVHGANLEVSNRA